MSTFLQIVNTVREEAGIVTGDLTTLQTGLSAESTRIKNWVNREWQRIQADKSQWQWMRQSGSFPTVASTFQYPVATIGSTSTPTFTAAQFGNWKKDSFRFYNAVDDEMLATYMPWDQYRNVYQYGTSRAAVSRPVSFSIAPNKDIWVGQGADGIYTCVYEMYLAPSALSADADVPGMPARFHDLIVFRALKAYGTFMNAPEVLARANEEIRRIQGMLMVDQLPIITSGPPLA